MLRPVHIRAWHIRTVLRRIYRLGARTSTPPNPLTEVILKSVPLEKDEAEMDRYRKYHESNQHGM